MGITTTTINIYQCDKCGEKSMAGENFQIISPEKLLCAKCFEEDYCFCHDCDTIVAKEKAIDPLDWCGLLCPTCAIVRYKEQIAEIEELIQEAVELGG